MEAFLHFGTLGKTLRFSVKWQPWSRRLSSSDCLLVLSRSHLNKRDYFTAPVQQTKVLPIPVMDFISVWMHVVLPAPLGPRAIMPCRTLWVSNSWMTFSLHGGWLIKPASSTCQDHQEPCYWSLHLLTSPADRRLWVHTMAVAPPFIINTPLLVPSDPTIPCWVGRSDGGLTMNKIMQRLLVTLKPIYPLNTGRIIVCMAMVWRNVQMCSCCSWTHLVHHSAILK